MKNEIVLYQSNELISHIEVRIEEDTVWLTQKQIATLFHRDRKTITRHIFNIFKEKELDENVVCSFFEHTTQHGAIKGKTQTKRVKLYNLDVIISVGYRVKSKQGTQFRMWATKILKDHLLKGYSLNRRMNRIEDNVQDLMEKVNDIDLQIKTNLPPMQDVFFNGQIFDAYRFVADLIRVAKKSIILIDNYVDDTVLTHFIKRKKGVKFTIFTKKISKQFQLDIEKHNEQYPRVNVKEFKDAHDRFLVIDEKEVYHFGASLKDLGKKWFAFSKMDVSSLKILDKLRENNLI